MMLGKVKSHLGHQQNKKNNKTSCQLLEREKGAPRSKECESLD